MTIIPNFTFYRSIFLCLLSTEFYWFSFWKKTIFSGCRTYILYPPR